MLVVRNRQGSRQAGHARTASVAAGRAGLLQAACALPTHGHISHREGGLCCGAGFIVDKVQGLILTNRHVCTPWVPLMGTASIGILLQLAWVTTCSQSSSCFGCKQQWGAAAGGQLQSASAAAAPRKPPPLPSLLPCERAEARLLRRPSS